MLLNFHLQLGKKSMNKIFSISMVKNEKDIIESFIRYHIKIFDGMLILDNGSTDGTIDIVMKIAQEGLPVYLIYDDNPSYIQSVITTKLLYKAIKKYSPDFIFPLDADEFIFSKKIRNLRKYFSTNLSKDSLHYFSWVTYVPTKKDDKLEKNILKRVVYRRREQNTFDCKVLIPSWIPKKYKVVIKQGNHDIEVAGAPVLKKIISKNVFLGHFPIRSINQAKSKYLVGWLANLARPNKALFDWYYYYNIIKSGTLSMDDISRMALYYDVIDKEKKNIVIKDPIKQDLTAFTLKYTESNDVDYIKNVLNYSENLAKKYSILISGKKNELDYHSDANVFNIIKDFLMIDGWLNITEACALYKTVKKIKNRNIKICEIGSWMGRSSYVFARAIEDNARSQVICIDPFNGDGDFGSKKEYRRLMVGDSKRKNLKDKFIENMEKNKVINKIRVIEGYSNKVVRDFRHKIDLLFIDGNHDYKSVLDDYLQWSPLIRKNGYIAFHDVGASHTYGPKQVVERYVVHNNMWGEHQLIDELYIAKKIK